MKNQCRWQEAVGRRSHGTAVCSCTIQLHTSGPWPAPARAGCPACGIVPCRHGVDSQVCYPAALPVCSVLPYLMLVTEDVQIGLCCSESDAEGADPLLEGNGAGWGCSQDQTLIISLKPPCSLCAPASGSSHHCCLSPIHYLVFCASLGPLFPTFPPAFSSILWASHHIA